jgi:hypothetical protein
MKMERELSAPAGLGLAEQQPMWLKLSPPRGSLRRLKLWREGPESSRSRVLEVNLEDRTVPYFSLMQIDAATKETACDLQETQRAECPHGRGSGRRPFDGVAKAPALWL